MKYTVSDFIMEQAISDVSFTDLMHQEILSEGAVLGSLCDQYVKQANLLQYMQEDGIEDIGQFDIFAEGVIVEADEPAKDGAKEGAKDGEKKGFLKTVGGKIKGWCEKILDFIIKICSSISQFLKRLFGGDKERLKQLLANENNKELLVAVYRMNAIGAMAGQFEKDAVEFLGIAEQTVSIKKSIKGAATKNSRLSETADSLVTLKKGIESLNDAGQNDQLSKIDKSEFTKVYDSIMVTVKLVERLEKEAGDFKKKFNEAKKANDTTNEEGAALGAEFKHVQRGLTAISGSCTAIMKVAEKFGVKGFKDAQKFDKKNAADHKKAGV